MRRPPRIRQKRVGSLNPKKSLPKEKRGLFMKLIVLMILFVMAGDFFKSVGFGATPKLSLEAVVLRGRSARVFCDDACGCLVRNKGIVSSYPPNAINGIDLDKADIGFLLACCRSNLVWNLSTDYYTSRFREEEDSQTPDARLEALRENVCARLKVNPIAKKISYDELKMLVPLLCEDIPWKDLFTGIGAVAEDFTLKSAGTSLGGPHQLTLKDSLVILHLHPVLPWYQFWCCVSRSDLEVYTRAIAASLQKVIIDRVASKQDSNSLPSWQDIVDKAKGQNSIGQKGEGPLLHSVHADAETPLLGEAVANKQQEIEDAERDIVIAYKWMIETYPFWPGKGK